jgi:hypothetical protein
MFQSDVPGNVNSCARSYKIESRPEIGPTLNFSTLCEIVSAVHLSRFVQSPFQERGGLFFVAPPGHLKTSALDILDQFDRTLILTNVVNKSLNAMRQDALAGTICTIGFSDWEMIYRRHGSVSSQIEGTVMALASEGYRNPAFTDQRLTSIPARCTIMGAMTIKFFETKYEEWNDSGFLRRFLFPQYRLANPEDLEDAIVEWRKAELDGTFQFRVPTSRSIPYHVERHEAEVIRHSLRHIKYDKKIAMILSQKIVAVLKWKFTKQDPKKPMAIWRDFAESFSKAGADLYIKESK